MKVEGTHELKAPRASVYRAMVDPVVLARTIPGCEKLEKTGENTYSVTLRAGVGSIKGLFTGIVRLSEMGPPEHYKIRRRRQRAAGISQGLG